MCVYILTYKIYMYTKRVLEILIIPIAVLKERQLNQDVQLLDTRICCHSVINGGEFSDICQ